jgi:hypothetical protein
MAGNGGGDLPRTAPAERTGPIAAVASRRLPDVLGPTAAGSDLEELRVG